jgi:hypothetical protein
MSQREFEFHFSKVGIAETKGIPANILVQSLEGLQRTVHLLAMEKEGKHAGQRDRISADIEGKYPVMCAPLAPGCVMLTASIGDPSFSLFAPNDIDAITKDLHDFWDAVVGKNYDTLHKIIPDSARRRRALDAVKSMLPKQGSDIKFTINEKAGSAFCDSSRLFTGIKTLQAEALSESEPMTVTGRLSKIYFDENRIVIIYPPTNKELNCVYDSAIEDLLLDNPREMIQVTGTVIFGEDNEPKKITEVENIEELDLSPFVLSECNYENYSLKFNTPISISIEQDETKQLLLAKLADIGLDVVAYTREDLYDEILADIRDLWENYVAEDETKLTEKAKRLRANLLQSMAKVTNG